MAGRCHLCLHCPILQCHCAVLRLHHTLTSARRRYHIIHIASSKLFLAYYSTAAEPAAAVYIGELSDHAYSCTARVNLATLQSVEKISDVRKLLARHHWNLDSDVQLVYVVWSVRLAEHAMHVGAERVKFEGQIEVDQVVVGDHAIIVDPRVLLRDGNCIGNDLEHPVSSTVMLLSPIRDIANSGTDAETHPALASAVISTGLPSKLIKKCSALSSSHVAVSLRGCRGVIVEADSNGFHPREVSVMLVALPIKWALMWRLASDSNKSPRPCDHGSRRSCHLHRLSGIATHASDQVADYISKSVTPIDQDIFTMHKYFTVHTAYDLASGAEDEALTLAFLRTLETTVHGSFCGGRRARHCDHPLAEPAALLRETKSGGSCFGGCWSPSTATTKMAVHDRTRPSNGHPIYLRWLALCVCILAS
ncbi:hypothetical protein ACMD2_23715 [Ananas comosus]|uniref:Uncharacterized protein n=1 Tax=Ananas comosus TaxID=4615 RepID=A0A199V563_ANACO|nr:hypothetical protein ACMD2_23715 [Ananas comosus]